MHTCPQCGYDCYCSGDIDDIQVHTEEWVYENCRCQCEELPKAETEGEIE